jgi:hypothetical protein
MSNGDHLWPAENESTPHARAKDNNGVKHNGADLDAFTPEQLAEEKRRIAGEATRKLEKVNAQYAIAAEGGKVWVIQSRHDPNYKGRLLLDRFTFAEWSKLYMNEWVTEVSSEGKIKNRPLPGWWLHHPHRRQYLGGIVLDPTGTPDGYYNLWQGYTVKPVPGSWSKLKTHILEVVCCNDEDLFEYLMNWLALLFQRPGDPGETAIVLKGKKGTGKGILCRAILDILGQHGLHISSSTHLVGRFNSHLRDCIFLFADEAFFAGDRQHEGVLKALITEPSIAIEGKGRDVVVVKNLLHVIMASNEDWVIPATVEERRYVVFNVGDARIRNFPYFKAITAEMDAGGREAMLHELLNRDIDSFEVRDVPETEGLREQKALSLDSLGQWWSAVLDRGYVYKSKYGTPWFADWHEFISTELLYQSYSQFCTAAKPYGRKSREALGKFMSKLHQGKRASNGGDPIFEIDSIDTDRNLPRSLDEIAIARSKIRVWGYDLGTIDEARARFEKAYGLSGVSG